jgi:hypothetical protein
MTCRADQPEAASHAQLGKKWKLGKFAGIKHPALLKSQAFS